MKNETKLTDKTASIGKEVLCEVLNTWDNKKVVYKGTLEECEKYLKGNNICQMNYSKLVLRRL
jgi:hypothetical protein